MNKKICNCFYVAILVVLVVVTFTFCVGTTDNIIINNEDITPFDDGWRYSVNGGFMSDQTITLPTTIDSNANDVVLIEKILPYDYPEGMTICFRSANQFVRVFVDDVEIYRFGHDTYRPFGKSPGSAWNFTRLHKATAGSKLSIEFISPESSFSGFISSVCYGSKNANVFSILEQNVTGFFISLIIILISVILFVIHGFFRKLVNNDYMLYLAWFALLAGTWSLAESRMAQFVISNQYVVFHISLLSIMLLPIPLMLFVSETHSLHNKKPYYIMCVLLLANFTILTLLQVFNIVDFLDSLIVTHILLIACAILAITTILVEIFKYRNRDIYILGLGTTVFVLVSMPDFLQFYGKRPGGNAYYFRFAVLFYIIILTYYTVHKLMEIMTQNMHTQMLEHLAYLDLLTNLQNRTAFEKAMEPYRASYEKCEKLWIGIFDINNLKLVNDTLGHKSGDDLLIAAVGCLNTIFSSKSNIYRIGGDEFAILTDSLHPTEIAPLMDSFEKEVMRVSKEQNLLLSVAYGIAQFDPSLDKNIDGLYVRADSYMYEKKAQLKKK